MEYMQSMEYMQNMEYTQNMEYMQNMEYIQSMEYMQNISAWIAWKLNDLFTFLNNILGWHTALVPRDDLHFNLTKQ